MQNDLPEIKKLGVSKVQLGNRNLFVTHFFPITIPILFVFLLLLTPHFIDPAVLETWNHAGYALYFSSPKFLFIFIPCALLTFYLTQKILGERYLIPIVLCISFLFYASWGIKFVPILLSSIAFNFSMRQLLRSEKSIFTEYKKQLLTLTVAGNLIFLGIFKYSDFFISSFSQLTGHSFNKLNLFLPFGISFFTFQEITLAVDTYRGAYRGGFLKYILFVSFFPHLVSGPLVHHREMMPQFSRLRMTAYNLTIGSGMITIGLFKKVVIADSLSPFVKLVFDADPTQPLSLIAAWTGALAYAFQIYFDFSGYSDMALGLARLFGVKLPINFNAPYKSQNIIEFWRRWHVTLSRFLREYLYFPLGGNRYGSCRRYLNLMIVMLLGGLWHGANWTFVIWGGLHGVFLVINHGWRALRARLPSIPLRLPMLFSQFITFACVVLAWVPFRSADFQHIRTIWKGMLGYNGVGCNFPSFSWAIIKSAIGHLTVPSGFGNILLIIGLAILYLICLTMPTSQQIMRLKQIVPGFKFLEPQPRFLRWRMNIGWAVFMGLLVGASILAGRQSVSEFLYWSF